MMITKRIVKRTLKHHDEDRDDYHDDKDDDGDKGNSASQGIGQSQSSSQDSQVSIRWRHTRFQGTNLGSKNQRIQVATQGPQMTEMMMTAIAPLHV